MADTVSIAMLDDYDAIVIGSGLGGLTAGALFAHVGQRILVLEQNEAFAGAATTYQWGVMIIEASLHETTDLRTALDPPPVLLASLFHLQHVPVKARARSFTADLVH